MSQLDFFETQLNDVFDEMRCQECGKNIPHIIPHAHAYPKWAKK